MNIRRSIRSGLTAAITYVLLGLSACTVTLVQPYDEKLLTDTEAFFKKASTMVDAGVLSSPVTDADRDNLKSLATASTNPKPLASNPAHASQFAKRYDELLTDADALILRALAKSQGISPIGERLQRKIEGLIQESIPSKCPEKDQEFSDLTASLTVKNYVDLKCIVVQWKAQHSDEALTAKTEILKRSNWELRRSTVFSAVLAIQSAETAKKK